MLTEEQWHSKHHRQKGGWLPSLESCRLCSIAREKCKAKVQYKSRKIADQRATEINAQRRWFPGSCLKGYHCRYCKKWHIAKAKRKKDLAKVEKMWRKWVRNGQPRFGDSQSSGTS